MNNKQETGYEREMEDEIPPSSLPPHHWEQGIKLSKHFLVSQ